MNLFGSRRSSVSRKNFALITALGTFFILICCMMYYYTLKHEQEVYTRAEVQFQNEINALIEMDNRTHIANILDISYWDDGVDFIRDRNEKWFVQNVVYALDTYHADYMAIYGPDGQFIRKHSSDKVTSNNFIPDEVFGKLRKDRLMKFYLKLPEGYVQVFASSIHPTADVQVQHTPAEGFFFIVKLLDEAYFESMERINNSTIEFAGDAEVKDHGLTVVRDLTDPSGDVVGQVVFWRDFGVSFQITKAIVLLLIGIFIFSVAIYFFLSYKWIFQPLNLITKILEKGDGTDIDELRNTPGEFRYIGKMFREYRNQKMMLEEAKARAEESDMLKSSFLTNISHEIRTPMNAISGFSDLLLTVELSEAERAEYIRIIHSSGKNLVSIIDDLIEMSKIDTNQVMPNYSAVDVDAVLNELHQSIKIGIPEDKNLDFQIRKPVKPLENKIITDGVKMKQILTNLITNAVKYTESGFVLFGYEVDPAGENIEFIIQDSGIGISEAHKSKIFERFHRIENDYTVKAGGLGLGLAITKAYIQMLGGEISLESREMDGTTFTVTLPVRYAERAHQIPDEPILDELVRPIRILVAEDDNINFLLIQKMLKMQNHEIIRARDGQEAVDICRSDDAIDLVMMDIKMPVLNGYEAFTQIRLFRPDLPVIAQTAYASAEDEKKILQFGFVGYVSKPINKENLFNIIKAITATNNV